MVNRACLFLVMAIAVSGCSVSGRLYTNIVEPLSDDFNDTPIGTKTCIIKNYRIRDPLSGSNVSVEWSLKDITESAKKAGISRIYYMDVHTFSVLLGFYRKKNIIVYGD